MNKTPKLCMMCGGNDHVQGVQCPECCSVCAGELDEEGKCSEFGCAQNNPPLAQGTSPKTSNKVPILELSQIVVGLFYNVEYWDGSVHRVTLTDKDDETVTIEYDDGTINRVPVAYFRETLQASMNSPSN